MTRPNIIVVFTDQQRWDTCGCYGQPLDVTPNLDVMARAGALFETAMTCQPVCGPARSCLQTGKYATETGCYRNGIALRLDAPTLARTLSGAGYEVGYLGKWHLASTSGPSDEPIETPVSYRTRAVPPERRGGYDDFWLASDTLEHTSHSYDGHMFDAGMAKREFPPGRYRVDAVTDWVLEYLQAHSQKRDQEHPFFLFVSYIEPHHQNDHGHYEGPTGSKERFADFAVPGDLAGTGGDWQAEFPDYLGCIHSLDENLGRIRAELERLGLADDTVVIFTSDHGSHFRTRNNEYKRACHEGCTRVPLVVYGGPFRERHVDDALVSLIDLPPTILTLAGVPVPGYMRGRPLQELLEGTPEDWPAARFMQISESHVGRALRTRQWKYSVRAPGRNGITQARSYVYVEDFLYDLEADPHERHNLVADPAHAATRRELARVLTEKMVSAGEAPPLIVPHACLLGPEALSAAGTLNRNAGGRLVMDVHVLGMPSGASLQVPLAEILEEYLGTPLVLDIQGTPRAGTLQAEDAGLVLVTPAGNREPLTRSLESLVGSKSYWTAIAPPAHAIEGDEDATGLPAEFQPEVYVVASTY